MPRPVNSERQGEVLDTAVAFLAEHGLAGLSLRKLAASMGVSTNVISFQFGSKHGLIDAALARARASTLDMLTTLRAKQPGIPVAEAIRELWAWWRARPERFAFPRLNMEAMMTSDLAALAPGRQEDLLSFWIEYFADWLQADGHSRERAEVLSTLLSAGTTGLVMDFISTGDAERVDHALGELARILQP